MTDRATPDRAATPAPLAERWYLGSMNDGLFIINVPPRPSTDDIWHDRPAGPTFVVAVSALPKGAAQMIVDAHNAALLAALDGREARWLPIESAQRDGKPLLLGRLGQIKGDVGLTVWWASSGFWSNKWSNWNDGVEPAGLAGPTHWMPLPAHPARPQPAGEAGDV